MTSAQPPTWSLCWHEHCYGIPLDHPDLCSLLSCAAMGRLPDVYSGGECEDDFRFVTVFLFIGCSTEDI